MEPKKDPDYEARVIRTLIAVVWFIGMGIIAVSVVE